MKIALRALLVLTFSRAALSTPAHAAPEDVALPPETVQLGPSPLPGHAVAMQKCGICHSADYVAYQPPGMTLAQWTAEMAKMQHAYGAPISDDEVRLLGVYLTSVYGDAGTVSDADRALVTVTPPTAATAGTPDVQALLAANGCLACHATDRKVFGPAYRDVAAKYRGDPQALAHVTAGIRQGGSGRWGAAAMPAFAGLSDADATALADYVLKR